MTGKENSHQKKDWYQPHTRKKDKKTAINNTVISLFVQIYDKFFMTSNFGSRNLGLFAVVKMQNFGHKHGRWLLKQGGRLIQ